MRKRSQKMPGTLDEPACPPHQPEQRPIDEHGRRDRSSNAATGASAAGVRAVSTQLVGFYFRAPAKAFFRTRIE